MKSFNWLHLTDLHFGLQGQDSLWPNVREVFWNDLEKLHEKSGPWDAVLFTGDLVQSGSEAEFNELEVKVLGPLWDRLTQLGSKDPVLLAVPGNHDLVRPDGKKPKAALRLMLQKTGFAEVADEFWSDPSCEYREIISTAFANYNSWAGKNGRNKGLTIKPGILPGDFAATLNIETTQGSPLKIGLAGINTTFLQLTNGDYRKRLAFDHKQLHQACGEDLPAWAKAHDTSIFMTHQGPDWFDETSAKEAYREVNPAGRFAVHLFGHMHENILRSNSIGGGRIVRQWQGNSLFGLEKFGEPPQAVRRHGYGAGRIEFDGEGATIRHWPRRAIKDVNGWRFDPDHDSCVLIEGDSCTAPERLPKATDNLSTTKSLGNTSKLQNISLTSSSASGVEPTWLAQRADLRDYCLAICKAHSHIRFVEIPLQKDLSPVQLDLLYVEPRLSVQEIHPDAPVFRWPETSEAVDALSNHRTLVVLGDPGSGKSMLISCLAWQLCRPEPANKNPWVREFGGCLPIPMILRELRLKADVTWEGLVDAFLEHHIGKLLPSRAFLDGFFQSGKAIILLDGLDEIGNLTIRRKLRDAIHSGMAVFQGCRWVLTSRIIGYDTVPFHIRQDEVPMHSAVKGELVAAKSGIKTLRSKVANVLFLAPFSDEQIEGFANNWYSQHEPDSNVVRQNAKDFVTAIAENHGTRRLARIPYLLTLMALIHHKNARLPHGRTELYERIATAYLEQIDLRRHLDQLPYSLPQKRRWLAEIAYRMQLQRSKAPDERQTSQILATEAAVKRWLRNAMKASSAQGTKEEVEALLDYFAKRSGLLLPRGEGMFAFMHLSLQEYFAACFIEPRLTASRFSSQQLAPEPTDSELHSWANHEAWREAFVLLFEMVSQKSVAETEGFLSHLFESRLEKDASLKENTAAGMLAEISTDPFVFLQAETRRKCVQSCWRWILRRKRPADNRRPFEPFPNLVVRALLRGTDGDLLKSWRSGLITKQELKAVEVLDLSGCGNLNDLSPLASLPNLRTLILRDSAGVKDLSPIAKLRKLETVNLDGCGVASLIPILCELKHIKSLVLGEEVDLNLLGKFSLLQELHLHYANAHETDLSALAELEKLRLICVPTRGDDVRVSDELRKNLASIKSSGLRRVLSEDADGSRFRRAANARRQNIRPNGNRELRKMF
jgi:predicted phosphodiesterase